MQHESCLVYEGSRDSSTVQALHVRWAAPQASGPAILPKFRGPAPRICSDSFHMSEDASAAATQLRGRLLVISLQADVSETGFPASTNSAVSALCL